MWPETATANSRQVSPSSRSVAKKRRTPPLAKLDGGEQTTKSSPVCLSCMVMSVTNHEGCAPDRSCDTRILYGRPIEPEASCSTEGHYEVS